MKRRLIIILAMIGIVVYAISFSSDNSNANAQSRIDQVLVEGTLTQASNGGWYCSDNQDVCGFIMLDEGGCWFTPPMRVEGFPDKVKIDSSQINKIRNGEIFYYSSSAN